MIAISRMFHLGGDEYCRIRFRCRSCKKRKSAILPALVALEVAGGFSCYACVPDRWLEMTEVLAREYATRPIRRVTISGLSGSL